MFSLIRLVITTAVLGAAAYAAFAVDLDGQPLVAHLGEIWSTPVVQKKVGQLRAGVTRKIEERLADSGRIVRTGSNGQATPDQLTADDRQALTQFLQQKSAPASR